MSNSVLVEEPVVWQHHLPRMPWAVSSVRVDARGPGVRLAYRLRTDTGDEDLLERRDERSRLALEAFSALRLDEMQRSIDDYLADVRTFGRSPARAKMRDLLSELVDFVRLFGPLGIGWSATFPVTNPVADELALRVEELERGSPQPKRDATTANIPSTWMVGLGRSGGGGEVRPVVGRRGRTSATESLPGDPLSAIREEQADLRMALSFAEAIAHNDVDETRALVRDAPWARHVSLRAVDPRGPDWRRVRRGQSVTGRGKWDPFDPAEKTDWALLGRLILARLIERQLRLASPRVVVDAGDMLRLEQRPVAALELVYRQLLRHVSDRQGFGIGDCGYCGGAILRTRHWDSGTSNNWHTGPCANAGRARRHRERREADVATGT